MRDYVELPVDGIYRETIVSKGVVDKEIETAKIIELSRNKKTGVIGKGISEGEVRDGVKVKLGRRVLDFVEKVFNAEHFVFNDFPEITTKRIIENHARLRKMGFPVINTMRLIDTPDDVHERILMTDLTEGGKSIVLTSYSHWENGGLGVMLSNAEEVADQLHQIYKKLNDQGVMVCHRDVFFLIVDKETGKGHVLLGDISRIVVSDDESYKPQEHEISKNNSVSIQDFVGLVNQCLGDEKIKLDVDNLFPRDESELTFVTEETVEETLLSLVPVFLNLRYQLQTNDGGLGKIAQVIDSEKDPNEVLASEVFKQYGQLLVENKETEIKTFFFGNEDDYNNMIDALNDPLKLRVLLAYYNIDDQTNWRRAGDAICNRQLHKNEGFPLTETVRQVMTLVNSR